MELKTFLGALSVVLAATAYANYIWKTLKEKDVEPHPFSWAIWGFVTGIAWWIQHSQGGGAGSWVTLFTSFVCFLITAVTYSKSRRRHSFQEWAHQFSAWDWIQLVIGLLAAACYGLAGLRPVAATLEGISFTHYAGSYLVAHRPALSAILATIADVIGYGPTLRKGWERPNSDVALSFWLNSWKFIPALFAMGARTIATCLYPATLVVMNAGVALMLHHRRGEIARAFSWLR